MGNTNAKDALTGGLLGLGNGLGLGSIMPDPLKDTKDALAASQQELRSYLDQSNIMTFQKLYELETGGITALNSSMNLQRKNQQITDEFINENLQLQSVTIIILYTIVAIILFFGFILA